MEVETTVALSATLAWLPMQREHPGISILAPARQKVEKSPSSESSFLSMRVGGVSQSLVGRGFLYAPKIFAAAR